MPLPTTFAGTSARGEGLFNYISLGANYWVATVKPANTAGFPITAGDGVTVDSSGNVYICGQGLNAAGFNVQFISKWNSSGVLQWQSTLTDPYSSPADSAYGIAVDSSGNVYVCGQGLTAANVNVQIVSKWNNTGTIQWQRTLNSAGAYKTQTDTSYGIYVDSSANVYVCGQGADGSGNAILSISKWDTSGTLQFQKKLVASSASVSGRGITLDSSGNIYVCGVYIGDVFISKWDSTGTLQWQKYIVNAGGVAGAGGLSIALDSSNNVYVAGYGQNAAGNVVQFIVKYNNSGTFQWQRTLTPTNSSPSAEANGIYVDSANYVYVCGSGTNASAANVQSISKWDSSGTIQWQRTLAASTPNDQALNIFVDTLGSMYVVGLLQLNIGIGAISIAKLPTDGSRTGTYSNSAFGFTYASSSWTAATSTWTLATSTLTASTSTWTSATSTWTAATSTWTPSTISV